GFSNIGANYTALHEQFGRKTFSQDFAWVKSGWGTHNFKFGYQYGQQSNNELDAYNTARVRLFFGRSYTVLPSNTSVCATIRAQNTTQFGQPGSGTNGSCRGDWGYYMVRDFA